MPSDVDARRVEIEGKHRGSGLAQWGLLLAPIFAAYAQQQLAYAFVTWACTRNLRFLVHLPTLFALGVIAATAVVARRIQLRLGGRSPGDERSSDARARFMAVAALTLAAFSSLLVLAQWLPALFIHPCLQ